MAGNVLNPARESDSLDRLRQLAESAARSFTFYRRLYEGINLQGIRSSIELPSINRQGVVTDGSLLHEVWLERPPFYFETSGSTGDAFPVLPDLGRDRVEAFGDFIDSWMKLRNDQIRVAMVALPMEMNPMGLKYVLGLRHLGISVIPAGVRNFLAPPSKVVDLLMRREVQLIVGRPLEIVRYAEAIEDEGGNPAGLSVRKIFVTGEILSRRKWQRISELYGDAEVYSTYGLTELDGGLVSCPEGKFHIPKNSLGMYVELIDDESRTVVGPSSQGEIVLTNLNPQPMPLIRYKTGDLAVLHEECSCHLGTPSLEILGRVLDRADVGGKCVLPIQIEEAVLGDRRVSAEFIANVWQDNLHVFVEQRSSERVARAEVESQIFEHAGVHAKVTVCERGHLADKLGIAKEKCGRFRFVDTQEEFASLPKVNFVDRSLTT
ncbi:phenylacetate--CoA ligase family protein [Paraburkholderia sp. MM6662-R1]|uniref:phenylacetate--CoA ligase family protein n=1 Tax=Paraburkholderia sp. MM6662-R1 TaxID=2991066 RepID=UPI003D2302F1